MNVSITGTFMPVTPEDPVAKRSEVIEEFWLKSAEIRKSLGLTPKDLKGMDDCSTQTSSTGDTFYASTTHTPSLYTSGSDSSSQTPHKSASSSPSTCKRNNQTPSLTDLESGHTHSLSGTPSSGLSHSSEAGEAGALLEEVVGRCSVVHRLSITLEGHVTEEGSGLASNLAPNSTGTHTTVPAPGPSPPSGPPVACRYQLPVEPALEREVLVNSVLHPGLLKQDRLRKDPGRAQSLPPDEVEVLCADEAQPCQASIVDHNTASFPSKTPAPEGARKDRNAPGSSRKTLSEGPVQVGGAEVWLRRPEVKQGAEEKEKKRSSLFSPLKSRKVGETQQESAKHKSLWKSVFSGYKKEKKRKEAAALAGTLPAAADLESRRRMTGLSRTTDLRFKKNLSFSEDTDLSCNAVLERSPLRAQLSDIIRSDVQGAIKEEEDDLEEQEEKSRAKPRRPAKVGTPKSSCPTEVVGLWVVFPDPSSISLSSTLFQKAGAEDELDAKLTRRVQRAARRQAKQEELRRLHRAQIIQRQLEQVEVKQRQLEEKGIAVEKALRGEADYWEDSSTADLLDIHLGGMGKKDDPSLMQQWFKLVQEKNALVRYESELMIFARELELEDRQSRLQQELRERMAVDDHLKGEEELEEEKRILGEMLDVVEQRDALVALLEEQRLREREEDSDLEAVMLSKGFNMHWA
ncbi:hypothetical protein NFI96_028497 [Prochilodus magdalenae]|nr:hypothetical protein NFI96_028497 [Prochilodus magdalenae]